MADKPKLDMEIQPDRSALFNGRDANIKIRVAFESPTQVRVEMWRETATTFERLAPDIGNIGSQSFRNELLKAAQEAFNPPPGNDEQKAVDTIPHLKDDLDLVAAQLGIPEISELLKPESGGKQVDQLIELVEGAGTLFNNHEGEPHVSIEVDEHKECHEIKGSHFRRWIRGRFYATEKARLEAQAQASYEDMVEQFGGLIGGMGLIPVKRPAAVRDTTLADAIAQLESMADYQGRVEEVFVRIGHHDGNLYVDLGNERWEAVEITAEGWEVIPVPPVNFVRPKGFLELPHPERGGSIDLLRKVLTLGDSEDDKRAWVLVALFLVNTLKADAMEHPILVLLGAQGSAKTSTGRMLRALIDPQAVEDTGGARSKEELHIDAECSWLMAYDNLSSIPDWLSDAMCRISTGSAFTKRTQYTNRDREIFKATQPQILNGISDVISRGDIIDRSLMVTLPVLSEYRDKAEVWADFYKVRPLVMGALYDAAAAGLKSIADGEKVEAKLPRMASFAKWSIRVETALGFEAGSFMDAIGFSSDEGVSTVLESEPIAAHIFRFAMRFTASDPWTGTTTQLLSTLNELETNDTIKRDASWPKKANKLSGLMGRLAPALANHGVVWKRQTESNKGGKVYLLYHAPPEDDTGDDKNEGGDDGGESTVPQETAIDKPNPDEGTMGTMGDDTFPEPIEDEDEGEI